MTGVSKSVINSRGFSYKASLSQLYTLFILSIYSFIYPFICIFILISILIPTFSSIPLFIHLFIRVFIASLNCLFIYVFIYLSISFISSYSIYTFINFDSPISIYTIITTITNIIITTNIIAPFPRRRRNTSRANTYRSYKIIVCYIIVQHPYRVYNRLYATICCCYYSLWRSYNSHQKIILIKFGLMKYFLYTCLELIKIMIVI